MARSAGATLLAALLAAPGALAQDPTGEVERWIADLAAPEWERREEAMVELGRIGLPALPRLEEAARSENLERAWRATALVERIQLAARNSAGIWESLVLAGPWDDSAAFAGATIHFHLEGAAFTAHWVVHGSGVPVISSETHPVELDGLEVEVAGRRFLYEGESGVLLDQRCVRWRLVPKSTRVSFPDELDRLEASEPERRRDALWNFVQPGAPERYDVIEARAIGLLDAREPEVRAQAAHTVGWWRLAEAKLRLRELLDDTEPVVRREAAEALGRLADAESRERIRALLADPDPTVEEHAKAALEELDR